MCSLGLSARGMTVEVRIKMSLLFSIHNRLDRQHWKQQTVDGGAGSRKHRAEGDPKFSRQAGGAHTGSA
jgi:hypothetical protein